MAKSIRNNFLTNIIEPLFILSTILSLHGLLTSHIQNAAAQSNIVYIEITHSPDGVWGNGNSTNPLLNGDGRFLIFTTEADNLVNPPPDFGQYILAEYDALTTGTRYIKSFNAPIINIWQSANGRYIYLETPSTNIKPTSSHNIYVFDRVTQDIKPFDITNIIGKNRILHFSISNDGRYLAFLTKYLANDMTNPKLRPILLDTYTNHVVTIPTPENETILGVNLSADSRQAAIATMSETSSNPVLKVYQYNRISQSLDEKYTLKLNNQQNLSRVQLQQSGDGSVLVLNLLFTESSSKLVILTNAQPIEINEYNIHNFALSADGNHIAFINSNSTSNILYRYSVSQFEIEVVDKNIAKGTLSLSNDGNIVAYAKYNVGFNQIYLAKLGNTAKPRRYLHGQILFEGDTPLGLVTVSAGANDQTKTDPNGYFYLSLPAESTTQTYFYKEGFEFHPEEFKFNGDIDISDIKIIARPMRVIEEAAKDLGMPYHYDRGCPSPLKGCGGPFHGFYAGYCTDLILDAYLWGANYNIQTALEHDALANPTHIYAWRNARNAHDMWRFFFYTGQLLSSGAPYFPGDIVFFDWDENGEIDHVALIAETYSNHTPRYLYDATGVIASNPTGHAAKLPWEPFHTSTLRGHARWNGLYIPPKDLVQSETHIQISAMGENLKINALDADGIALTEKGMATRSNVTSFDLRWEQQLDIEVDNNSTQLFTILITNQSDHPVNILFLSQILHQGFFVDQVQFERTIRANSTITIPLKFQINAGTPDLVYMYIPQTTHR